MDEKPAVRIDWDYGLILEWASDDERHDIGLFRRISG